MASPASHGMLWGRATVDVDALEEVARARVGKRLAKWTLERLLGIGGMAAVYEARHDTGRLVAVKVMHGHLQADSKLRTRFIREAHVVNSIDHSALVPVHDVDVDEDGTPFLVMDLLRGQSVEGLRKRRGGKLDVELVVKLAETLLEALAEAHESGIVHRDIKPANLFLTETGELKLLDFGIAASTQLSGALSAHTKQGTLLGTPAFMPPEQARGHFADVDCQSDVYAAGATLFTLLTGETVHVAQNANEQWGMAMSTSARKLARVAPKAPPEVIRAVDGALSYTKGDRWKGASEMLAVLSGAEHAPQKKDSPPHAIERSEDSTLSKANVTAGTASRTYRAGNRQRLGMVLAATFGVAGAAYLAVSRVPTPAPAEQRASGRPVSAPHASMVHSSRTARGAPKPTASVDPPAGPRVVSSSVPDARGKGPLKVQLEGARTAPKATPASSRATKTAPQTGPTRPEPSREELLDEWQ